MAIKTSLRTLFLAEGTITATLTNAARDIYIENAHQWGTDKPGHQHIVISLIDGDPYVASDGTTGLRASEIDVDCKAPTQAKAQAIADAVETYFADYTGAAGDDTIRAVVQQEPSSDYIPHTDGSQGGIYIETLTFLVQWE